MEVLQLGMWRDSAGFPLLGGIKMGNRAPGNSGNLLHHQEGIGRSPPGNMGGSSWISIHGCHKCGNRGLGSPWRSSPSIPVPAAPGRSCQDLTESRKSSGTLEFDCASELREHKSHSQQFYGKPSSLWGGSCSKIILFENSKEVEPLRSSPSLCPPSHSPWKNRTFLWGNSAPSCWKTDFIGEFQGNEALLERSLPVPPEQPGPGQTMWEKGRWKFGKGW